MTLHNSLSRPRRKLRYSNGRLADGTREKTPLSQKSSSVHIGGKIRNYCSRLSTLRSMLHSRVGPTCRGLNVLCIRSPWSIKGRRPLEDLRLGKGQGQRRIGSYTPPRTIYLPVDVGYYAPAARTTLNLAVLIVFLSEIDLD